MSSQSSQSSSRTAPAIKPVAVHSTVDPADAGRPSGAPGAAHAAPAHKAHDPHHQLRELILSELADLVHFRRDLHRHPELSFQERRTSSVVQKELQRLGIPFKAGLGGNVNDTSAAHAGDDRHDVGTGILAHLPATHALGNERPAVALRADMDALPISEQTGKPYSSIHPGVMHACGHDGHTTILLGVARILSKLRDRPNAVTFIFQPAEEGGGGGEVMCNEGVLKGGAADDATGGLGTPVGRIFGLHGWPSLGIGLVQSRPGPMFANTDDFVVTVRGVQAHAAYPHLGRDPILTAAYVVTALQTLASRSVNPLDSVVCTVGQFNAGTANNIIPETATIIGTIRTLNPTTRALAKERFFALVESTCAAHGCTPEIDWQDGYPATINDAALTDHFFDIARDTLGDSRVGYMPEPTMGGEDFSYYGHHVPACFFALGLKPPGTGRFPSLHQPDFDFNDEAIPTGIELFCRLALAEWKR
jgi:amidohydrolase